MEEEYRFTCPHCWQEMSVVLDLSAGGQTMIQDCEVCCNPLEFVYEVRDAAVQSFEVRGIGQ